MPTSTKLDPKREFPRLQDVSPRYASAVEELDRVRERAKRVEALVTQRKADWKRANNRTRERPDIDAYLDGEVSHVASPGEAEARFREAQHLARIARKELAAAESKVRNTRSRESGKLLRAPEIRAQRTTRLQTIVDGLDAVLDAAQGLEPTDEFLTRELGSPTAGGGSTVRTIRLETPLAVLRRLRDDITAELNSD